MSASQEEVNIDRVRGSSANKIYFLPASLQDIAAVRRQARKNFLFSRFVSRQWRETETAGESKVVYDMKLLILQPLWGSSWGHTQLMVSFAKTANGTEFGADVGLGMLRHYLMGMGGNEEIKGQQPVHEPVIYSQHPGLISAINFSSCGLMLSFSSFSSSSFIVVSVYQNNKRLFIYTFHVPRSSSTTGARTTFWVPLSCDPPPFSLSACVCCLQLWFCPPLFDLV